MKFQEFMNKAKLTGLNGKPHIDGRHPTGDSVTITLTFIGTNNDMIIASDFGDHQIGPVNVTGVAKSQANASGFRRMFLVEDV